MAKRQRWRRVLAATTGIATLVALTACSPDSGGGQKSSGGDVTIEFMQWWEPELPDGSFRELINQFEKQNPGITVKLISGPWSQTKDQITAGAATGTVPDVVGLDGSWVYDLVQQGVLADLGAALDENGFDKTQLSQEVALEGVTYMTPVVNFAYPMYVNLDLLKDAGVSAPPTNRTEFLHAAKKLAALNGVSGWALPLDLETANGAQNDILAWTWAGGSKALDDSGKPNLVSPEVESTLKYVKDLWDAGVVAEGANSMKEPDKVEEFVQGRVGMIFSSPAHINLIRKSNPDLNFTVAAPPVPDGYTGKVGWNTNSWGIGLSATSEHPKEAYKLLQYLMSPKVNAKLSEIANGFPGNNTAEPDLSASDEMFQLTYKLFSNGYPMNEFTGAPVATELQREFVTEIQKVLNGDESIKDALSSTQEQWTAAYK